MKHKKVRLWTLETVRKSLPLVGPILLSVREQYLQLKFIMSATKKINSITKRLTKEQAVKLKNLCHEGDGIAKQFADSLRELENMGVFCQDPVRCLAGFPFRTPVDNVMQSSWFMYSPFANDLYWRFDYEPILHRRELGNNTKQ